MVNGMLHYSVTNRLNIKLSLTFQKREPHERINNDSQRKFRAWCTAILHSCQLDIFKFISVFGSFAVLSLSLNIVFAHKLGFDARHKTCGHAKWASHVNWLNEIDKFALDLYTTLCPNTHRRCVTVRYLQKIRAYELQKTTVSLWVLRHAMNASLSTPFSVSFAHTMGLN